MTKGQERYETIVIILGIIGICISFFSPVIISLFTGEWFYMFLFLISWIPTLGIIFILKFLLSIYE